ncbi:Uncharacterized protein TPAR_05932 [Tolypocladium paradoxum]|uniref:Uncharacterized protein n=1 Tax=Tolypocladium paradoxum TaxID=94208 RepID=A0A2S4KUL3_9HYPO|nr:Uncharacterized protein TPAR_05932 [Tolypocladium paradoxum]
MSLPLCMVAVYFVQRAYLRTSRQLRVLELESQAALYSSFLETVEGIVTIRSFGWQSALESKNLGSLNYSLRPFYMLLCLQRWLNLLVLELIVSAIAIGLIGVAVTWSDTTPGGEMGVALNLILVAITTLVRLVESWTSLEISLGAISRLKAIELRTAREDQPWENNEPDPAWPRKDDLHLLNSLDQPVLRAINLTIRPGQKLVICGRTGIGKSTMLLALMRLVESSGSIKVDGEDICRVPRSIDPFLIPDATLRFNLDPSSSVSDGALQSALTKVGIWDHLSSMPGSDAGSPLYECLSSLPALSVGQSQLLATARAIVQKHSLLSGREFADQAPNYMNSPKPILLLDEATSSLDTATESIIHDVIDREFVEAGHTVIIVSHRMSAMAGRMRPGKDLVALLQDGSLVKVGGHKDIGEGCTDLG